MKKAYLSMAIISIIMGIMFAVQYRSSFTDSNIFSRDQWAEMTIQLEHLRNQHDALINERTSLRNKIDSTGADAQSAALRGLLNTADIAAGMTAVTGPGVSLDLDNAAGPEGAGKEPGFVIEYWNLLMLVNELKAAGADAISLNGERIVATTGIGASGSDMMVNNHIVKAPYRLLAIGKPETLESTLRIKSGQLEALEASGVETSLSRVDSLEIPAYRESIQYKYAKSDNGK